MDVMKEKKWLYELQKKRVTMDHEIEQKLHKTFPSLTNDIRVMKELLDDMERAEDQQKDMNYTRKY